MSIVRLPPQMVSRIAAGEIVERPASVVKELVENSLDAQATEVEVKVEEGGKVSIGVKDNGSGMQREDLLLAFERHATSKIRDEHDLREISTFGFRGEALPSVASVAKVTARSRVREEDLGTEVRFDGGDLDKEKPVAMNPGTSIEVRELFYNTPGRRKFLRTTAREKAAIEQVMNRFLLAFPRVGFKLRLGREEERYPPASLRERFSQLFEDKTLELHHEGGVSIRGLISPPGSSRASREVQYFFVNDRFVRSGLLNKALYDAYHTLLPRHRHPAAIIFLEVPPSQVDVNVHPSKVEVKFPREKEVYGEVVRALEGTLLGKKEEASSPSKTLESFGSGPQKPPQEARESRGPYGEGGETGGESPGVKEMEPLAQIFNTYIIAEQGGRVAIVDQHAAHERVLYEEFKENYSQGKVEKQKLLRPEVIHLAPREKAALMEKGEFLERAGFEVEDFGGQSVAVRAAPLFLGEMESFEEIIAQLAEAGRRSEPREELIYRVACTNAVKAGDFLLPREMETILKKLSHTKNPHTCPHGRPTYISMKEKDLEKWFRR